MVVEITPIGIHNLGWKFYLIWLIFNASFVPIVYLFYPETASRTLEDIDAYFRDHHNILVFRDKAATSQQRPTEYVDKEETQVRRRSSVNPRAASLAARHARFGSISVDPDSPLDGGRGDEKEFVKDSHTEKV